MPTVVGVGAATFSATAITPAFPGGYTAIPGDVAITYLETTSEIVTAPTNWASVTTVATSSGELSRLSAFWRRLTAGEAAPTYSTTVNHQQGQMIVVRSCRSAGNPFDQAPATTEAVVDTTVSIPGVTTTFPNCLLLYAFGTGQDIFSAAGATGWANAALSNVVEQMDSWSSTGLGGGFAVASGGKVTPGATGAMTATLSLTANFKTLMCISLVGDSDDTRQPLIRSARPIESGASSGNYAMPTSSTILGG